MDAAMAATIALKEQTKNRMNFETGYLFCHVETKSFKLWLEAFFFVLAFKLFIALPKAERGLPLRYQ